ncbi:hypothetical protein C8T65DRAFT_650094 [Cerioporus squamosus]|nr:hypothetical protein C8T65DRAFT_650094 [Cerioporus squamosus]
MHDIWNVNHRIISTGGSSAWAEDLGFREDLAVLSCCGRCEGIRGPTRVQGRTLRLKPGDEPILD